MVGLVFLLAGGYEKYQKAAHPLEFQPLIEQYSEQYGITPSLICGVICTESHFRPEAVSPAGAMGLMQLTPETFRWAQVRDGVKNPLPKEDLFEPEMNIKYGVFTLHLLLQMFEDPKTALAAYNAGQGNVKKWLADPSCSEDGVHLTRIPFPETEEYVKRVEKAQTMYRKLYSIE